MLGAIVGDVKENNEKILDENYSLSEANNTKICYYWKNFGMLRSGYDMSEIDVFVVDGQPIKINFSDCRNEIELPDDIIENIYGTLSSNDILNKVKGVKLPKKLDYDEKCFDGFAWQLTTDVGKYHGTVFEPIFIKKIKNILKFDDVKTQAIKFLNNRNLKSYQELLSAIKKDPTKCITNRELRIIVDNVVEENSITTRDRVFMIVSKIRELKNKTKTSIAKLINYDSKTSFVEPLTQGKISKYVDNACELINIKLEYEPGYVGGLAYFYEFTILK